MDNLELSNALASVFGHSVQTKPEDSPDDILNMLQKHIAENGQPMEPPAPQGMPPSHIGGPSELDRLKDVLKQTPEEYRAKRMKESWFGRHKIAGPIVGSILEALAGFSGKPGPVGMMQHQIDQDFQTQRSSNQLLMQTLMGEERAKQAATKEEDLVNWRKAQTEAAESKRKFEYFKEQNRQAEAALRIKLADRSVTLAEQAQAIKEMAERKKLELQERGVYNDEVKNLPNYIMLEYIDAVGDPKRQAELKEYLGLLKPPRTGAQPTTTIEFPPSEGYDAQGNPMGPVYRQRVPGAVKPPSLFDPPDMGKRMPGSAIKRGVK